MKQLRKEFIKFLKENNAFIPFVVQLSIQGNTSLTEHLSLFSPSNILHGDSYGIIKCAFKWSITPQSSKFWKNLDIKWKRKIGYYAN